MSASPLALRVDLDALVGKAMLISAKKQGRAELARQIAVKGRRGPCTKRILRSFHLSIVPLFKLKSSNQSAEMVTSRQKNANLCVRGSKDRYMEAGPARTEKVKVAPKESLSAKSNLSELRLPRSTCALGRPTGSWEHFEDESEEMRGL